MPKDGGRQALRTDSTVDARISRFAETEPEQTVIVHHGKKISRAELERQANAIAARLDQAGVGYERTVAVCLPRSIDQIAASLAVMKIGSACLPLSPGDPLEMLRFKLADCDVEMLLVDDDHDPRLAAASGAALMKVEIDHPAAAAPVRPAEVGPYDAHRVAWIASSTGVGAPACGVEITHANILFLSEWLSAKCKIGKRDRVCHMAEPGASVAMLEIWPPMVAGATIVIMDDETAASAERMRAWIEEQQITALVAGEDVIDALVELPIVEGSALRLVMTDLEHTKRYPANPPFRLLATYGHEECGLISSAHLVARNERPGGPHIGRPIAGASIHILDETGAKVADGEEGEMWIGGPGVGRGYRNRPDLTAERFVPDPFGDDPAGLIFRTGRRGRTLIGGIIGRRDHQARAG